MITHNAQAHLVDVLLFLFFFLEDGFFLEETWPFFLGAFLPLALAASAASLARRFFPDCF